MTNTTETIHWVRNSDPIPEHAHVQTWSRDCDGGHGYDYIAEMTDDEKADDWPEYAFRQRVIAGRVSVMTEFGQKFSLNEEGFEWHEQTDEGFSAGEVRWCRDDCTEPTYPVWDEYAEMDGY